jgi:hypothetical protein
VRFHVPFSCGDRYLAYSDVEAAMASAAALGCRVLEVEGYKDHVKSLFRKPTAIFGTSAAAAAAAPHAEPAAAVAAVVAADASVVPAGNGSPLEYRTFNYFAPSSTFRAATDNADGSAVASV